MRVGDLPKELRDQVVQQLRPFCVGLTRNSDTPKGPQVTLLGSGTLVAVGSKRAILTAHHVVKILPRTGRLGLLLGPTDHPFSIDAGGLSFLEIARGSDDSIGPDLGAIILSAPIASSIGAQKSFYNLDSRREMMLNSPPHQKHGYWIANGFVDELTLQGRAGGRIEKCFRNLSATGGAEPEPDVEGYDYFSFPVSEKERERSPRSFGGMSGGGLWQVPVARESGLLVNKPPLLSGVVFYQIPTTETECGVRCHGRKSIYETAYDAIRGPSGSAASDSH